MNVLCHWRRARSWAGAALLLAAAMAVVPAEARAGCHHPWVVSSSVSSGRLDDLELLRIGRVAAGSDAQTPVPGEDRTPCAGGRCTPAPDLPAGAVAPPRFRHDSPGVLSATSYRAAAGRSLWVPARSPLHSVRRPDPIDRPPRAGTARAWS